MHLFYFCEAVGFRLCRVYKSRLYRSCPVALKLVKKCRAVESFRVACNGSSSKNSVSPSNINQFKAISRRLKNTFV